MAAKTTEQGNYAYQYDELYRLTGVSNAPDEAYTYDAVGNRLTGNIGNQPSPDNYTYNENNELIELSTQTSELTTYSYDANGNIISKTDQTGTTTYTYDVDNRLVQLVTPNSQLVTYYYDPFGRRLWKEVNGIKKYFLYSDEGLIGEYDANGNEIKTYGYAPNSTWTTNPLFQKIGPNYYWYQNDHLGTPQKMIDSSSGVVWAATYDVFGKANVTAATIENNLRFPGQYHDQETGLHYNYFRYYNPLTGRYITPDPIGLEGGINLFSYVGNDPLNWADSSGEVACKYSITGKYLSCIVRDLSNCSDQNITCYAESGNNNPKDQCKKFVGPIPVGSWKIGKTNANGRAALTPYAGTNTCKPPRTDLQIHALGTLMWSCIAVKSPCAGKILD